MPSMPPSALAATETTNSNRLELSATSADRTLGSRLARGPGYEADLIATVIEFFVIDGLVTSGVRCALYQEYRTAHSNTEGSGYY
jgi:hypothetical protein